ncbi:MAG: glucokinase, partial [Prochlorococcus sp.]
MASISLLAGDMGGTKTLLGLFSWDGLQLRKLHQHRYNSAQWAAMEPMLESFLDNRPANVAPPSHSCIA